VTGLACCPLDNEPASHLFEKRGYPHYRCDACGLHFVWPLPEPEVLSAFYGEDHRPAADDPAYQADRRYASPISRETLLGDLPDGYSMRDRTLLDVGCGLGYFLDAVRKDFRRVRGIEVSESRRTFARKSLGLEVLEGEAAAIPLADECEDVIILWHVLEHLPDLGAALREVRRVLKPEGLLVIVTPNPGSITARLLGHRWYYFTPPGHLYLFPPRALVRFLESEGFGVLTVRTDTLLLHHLLEVRRSPETERAGMVRSTAWLNRTIRRNRLLKAAMDAINALLAHWHIGDKLRITARKNT